MKSKLLVTTLGFFIAFNVQAFDLFPAPLCDGDPNTKGQMALEAGKIIGNVYANNSVSTVGCIGWTSLGYGDVWYDVTKDIAINAVNIKKSSLLNSWPITPWANHFFLAGEYDASTEKGSNIRGKEFSLPRDPLQVVTTRPASYYELSNYTSPGCLNKTPLRYGDIDGDSNAELAIFQNDTVVFFSPQQGKVIFSYHYQLNDEMTADDAALVFLPPYQDTDPQYIAGSGQDELVREIFPAQRSLSKIYIQDFNGDKIPDIVLWRKMYRSNLRNNSVQGFHLLAETWVHYQLTDGEYLLQDTAPETIQNWLSTAQLTWSKGFPSLSECPGEEGKLISEMHDPLLNDPDVLQ